MFSPEKLIHEIKRLPRGTVRLDALNNAITEADAANAHQWRFYFRYEYLQESIFHEDNFKAIIRFPELLAVFDEHPELEEDNYHDMMWAYKLILENLPEYYQITLEEIERYYEDYKKRCEKYGISLRVYHMKKSKFYRHLNPELARKHYDAYTRCKRDSSSDCHACETDSEMQLMLDLGDEEEAMRLARPLLEGKLHCAEVPHVTYGALAEYYLYKGDLAEAAYHGSRCERLINNQLEFLYQTGTLLELNSILDPSHGWRLFKQSVDNFVSCRNPLARMYFARGAYRLLSVIIDQAENEEGKYTHSVLMRALPVQTEERGTSLEALRDYFYDIAEEQSRKLDARNGNTYYSDRLNHQFEAAAKSFTGMQTAAAHGLVQKAQSAIFVTLPEGVEPTLEELAERIRTNVPADTELVNVSSDDDVHIVLRRDGGLFEADIIPATLQRPVPARAVSGLDAQTLEQMQAKAQKFVVVMELGDKPMRDYALTMRIVSVMFPEMLGLIDAMTQHAYPASWVHFVGQYPDAVGADDLYGLYLSGSEEEGVWMTTIGMRMLGMRDLEVSGATTENFSIYANMLDNVARQFAERGLLPDAGEPIAGCRCGEEAEGYEFTWALQEIEGEEEPSAVLLLQTDDGNVPPVASGLIDEETVYPSSNFNFHRRIRLAKATYDIFRSAVQKPFHTAGVRLEFALSDEMAEKYEYGIELLWADVSRVEDGKVYAKVAETSETVPEIQEGDEVEVTADNITGWFIRKTEQSIPLAETEAHLLCEEA